MYSYNHVGLCLLLLVSVVSLGGASNTGSTLTVSSIRKYDQGTRRLYIYDSLTLSATYPRRVCPPCGVERECLECIQEQGELQLHQEKQRCECVVVQTKYPSTAKVSLFMRDVDGQWEVIKQDWSYNLRHGQFEAVKDLLQGDIMKRPNMCENKHTCVNCKTRAVGMEIGNSEAVSKFTTTETGNAICYMAKVTYQSFTTSAQSISCSLGNSKFSFVPLGPALKTKNRRSSDPFNLEISSFSGSYSLLFFSFQCDVKATQYGSDLNLNPAYSSNTRVFIESWDQNNNRWEHFEDLDWKRYRSDGSNRFRGMICIFHKLYVLIHGHDTFRCVAASQGHIDYS